jgi:hypothetical protein
MQIETLADSATRLTVDGQERCAIFGAFGWVTAGPFAASYDGLLSSEPEWSRGAAEVIATKFEDGDGLEVSLAPAEVGLLTAVLEAALDGERPLPRNDWEILTRAPREIAVRLVAELRAVA